MSKMYKFCLHNRYRISRTSGYGRCSYLQGNTYQWYDEMELFRVTYPSFSCDMTFVSAVLVEGFGLRKPVKLSQLLMKFVWIR